MTKDNENEFLDSEELDNEDYQPEEGEKQPWNRNFSQDENFKKRQYSRAARNQPVKEATTLSKVLLFIMIITVIAPFVLYIVVDSRRDNDQVANRTAENITISRQSDETTQAAETTKSDQTTQSESETSRETIETTAAPQTTQATTVAPTPEPEPTPPATTYYTVQAGDSWYGIARNHGIDVYELAAFNNASIDSVINPGDTIAIP